MKGGFSTFNARADGIDTKPTFKDAWKAGRRGLVLVGGFFESRPAPGRLAEEVSNVVWLYLAARLPNDTMQIRCGRIQKCVR